MVYSVKFETRGEGKFPHRSSRRTKNHDKRKSENALIKSAGKRKKLTAEAVTVIVLAAAAAAAAGVGKKNAMPAGMMGQQTMNNVATVKAVAPQTGSIEKTTSLAGKVEPAGCRICLRQGGR